MPAPLLDTEFVALLEALPLSLGEITVDSLPEVRSGRLSALQGVELSEQVTRTDHIVPGPAGAPEVTVRIHTPVGAAGPLPCVFSIHGGGYILGTRDMDDARHDQWCPELGYIGASVEYRLAPETPYPGPLEDCYAGLTWVHSHAEELGIDPTRIGISGASAGGGLAAGLALLVRDRGEIPITFQCLIYPMIDDRQVTPSSHHTDVPIWNPSHNTFGWRSYLGDLYGTDAIPGYAAATRATDLTGLPPAFVCVGTVDGFCDEDIEYAQRLIQAGVPTELHVYPGAPHGFDMFGPLTKTSERGARAIREWLASVL